MHEIESSPQQFVIAAKNAAKQTALNMLADGGGTLVQQLREYSGVEIEVVEAYSAARASQFSGAALGSAPVDTLLVRMDGQKGAMLQAQSTQPTSPIWIEPNLRCDYFFGPPPIVTSPFNSYPGQFSGAANSRIEVQVIGEQDRPLQGAVVTLYAGIPLTALTDDNGMARFELVDSALQSIRAVVVDPRTSHWSKVIRDPVLRKGTANVVQVKSFKQFDPDFERAGSLSWGNERLGLRPGRDQNGGGVRVGVVDSGCDATHTLLQHVKRGINLNPSADPAQWTDDDVGHGTHCAGIIAAKANDAISASGIAPESEIYTYKVFPDGSFFTLGKAIDNAINDGVDILNLSLGCPQASPFLTEKLDRARQAGIACFVAAGNSGNDVMFPASLSSVVAVSALGYSPVLPSDSISAQSFSPALATSEGYFSPLFTCFGPSIDLVAPGVGIVSTVPQDGLKVMDGTSMAAPHVAGLGALLLAHDPMLKSLPRSAGRVDALVSKLKQRTMKFPFGFGRVGAGLPTFSLEARGQFAESQPMYVG